MVPGLDYADKTKGSLVKRHERYCRNQKRNPGPPRQKSCLPCIHAKTRCDSRKPACETCQLRGRKCRYTNEPQANKRRHDPSRLPADFSERTSDLVNLADSHNTPSRLSHHFLTSIAPSGPQLPSVSTIEDCVPRGTSPGRGGIATANKPLKMPTRVPTNILRRKVTGRSEFLPLKSLISRVLCSFPERMMDKHICPPFIHPSIFVTSKIPPCAVDPIGVCRDLCQKFPSDQIATDISFWDIVAQEQEKIYDLRYSPSKWVHLASAQAITIYLLLLVSNRDYVLPHHPNLPITLLFTLRTSFEHLHRILPGYTTPTTQTACRPTWEDWIFAESKLRTATVYFILASCYDVDFGLPCDREIDHEFGELELPATKPLWEAKHEDSWNAALTLAIPAQGLSSTARTTETKLRYSNLVESNKGHTGSENSGAMELDSSLECQVEMWHKEMDELGMLVALCSMMCD